MICHTFSTLIALNIACSPSIVSFVRYFFSSIFSIFTFKDLWISHWFPHQADDFLYCPFAPHSDGIGLAQSLHYMWALSFETRVQTINEIPFIYMRSFFFHLNWPVCNTKQSTSTNVWQWQPNQAALLGRDRNGIWSLKKPNRKHIELSTKRNCQMDFINFQCLFHCYWIYTEIRFKFGIYWYAH